MIPWLHDNAPFPPLEQALDEPNGLLAAGGTLSTERLLSAYKQGIFPWSSEGQPLLWWSPDPRMILYTEQFKISRSLKKLLNHSPFIIRADSAFRAVMQACAEPRLGQEGTWITAEMMTAYCELHRLGYAHSVEVWREEKLVGGLYGVAIGHIFFGESMFARESNASKLALARLVQFLRRCDVPLIDCQQETSHLASLGAQPVPRFQFASLLKSLVDLPPIPSPWRLE